MDTLSFLFEPSISLNCHIFINFLYQYHPKKVTNEIEIPTLWKITKIQTPNPQRMTSLYFSTSNLTQHSPPKKSCWNNTNEIRGLVVICMTLLFGTLSGGLVLKFVIEKIGYFNPIIQGCGWGSRVHLIMQRFATYFLSISWFSGTLSPFTERHIWTKVAEIWGGGIFHDFADY